MLTRSLAPVAIACFLFAIGYFACMTYSVALLVDRGAGNGTVSAFWSALGLAAVLTPAVWSRPIAGWEPARSLGMLLLVVAAGTALPLLLSRVPAIVLSGVLFGGSFLSVVASVTSAIRRMLPADAWDAGIAALTVIFAAGRILGPLLSGVLAECGGGLESGLAWSATALVLGAVSATAQPPRCHLDAAALREPPTIGPGVPPSRPFTARRESGDGRGGPAAVRARALVR